MADIVSSLFGLSPREQYTRDRQQEFEMQARTASGMYDNQYDRQNAYLGSKVGSLLAQGVGNLFGLQDPALKRMSGLEGVLQEAQQELGQDMADPTKLYPTLAGKLQQRGFGREAAMVSMQGQEAINQWKLNQAKLDNENAQSEKFRAEAIRAAREDNPQMKIFNELAKNSSPKAVAQAIANGYDISMLDSPEKTKMSSKAQELVDAGFAYGTPAFNARMQQYINSEMSGRKSGDGAKVIPQVVNPTGAVVGTYDDKGNFKSVKGDVFPAKVMTDNRAKHEMALDLYDKLDNISSKDIDTAFNRNMDYTTSETAQYFGGKIVGKDVVEAQQRINQVKVKETLNALQSMKGSTSDKEMGVILSSFPGYSARPAAMRKWLTDAKAATAKFLNKNAEKFGGDFSAPSSGNAGWSIKKK
jgi:hypothetical protein